MPDSPTQAEVLDGVTDSDVADRLSPEQEECVVHLLLDEFDDAQLREVADGRETAEISGASSDEMVRDCGVTTDQ